MKAGTVRAGTPDRLKSLDNTVGLIERQFGKGAIMRLGEERPTEEGLSTIPTGSLSLDLALGIGGVPRGRIIEVFGPESSGKTTLVLHMMANAQRQGGTAAFIDAEHALDAKYSQALGVNIDDLLVSQPDTGEQALEITDMLVRSNAVDIIAVDSVAALVPRAEIEGEMGDANVGLQARLMSQAMRKLTASVAKSRTCIVFINQIRMKIGVMFGNPETTTGGNALKFYATMRLDIRRIGALKEGTTAIGNRTRVKVVKNKLAPPFREAEFDIIYGKGISFEGDVLDLATEKGIVEKSGSWFSYGGERVGQGRESARTFLEENRDVLARLEREVRTSYGLRAEDGPGGSPTKSGAEKPEKAVAAAEKGK